MAHAPGTRQMGTKNVSKGTVLHLNTNDYGPGAFLGGLEFRILPDTAPRKDPGALLAFDD